MKSEKILTCKEEIKTFLGNVSDYMFDKYIKAGMPARCTGKEWIAYTGNIEKWFEAYTRVKMPNALKQKDGDPSEIKSQKHFTGQAQICADEHG
ncbi:MAG: hypothetical protein JRF53_16810 [Deltaproteobacteria bacterium]|nr:hypothetical protein [Deltaproteobacteria bacterium]